MRRTDLRDHLRVLLLHSVALVIVLAMTSCTALLCRRPINLIKDEPPLYGGTVTILRSFVSAPDGDTPDPLAMIFGLVDLPLTLVVDTMLFPIEFPIWLNEPDVPDPEEPPGRRPL